uniref:FAD-binding PCMH-type domain-containing protein n=1 Tax=Compsopogon caeruleus TaxID=31354 RepID=A0A7S1TC26_9RHOD
MEDGPSRKGKVICMGGDFFIGQSFKLGQMRNQVVFLIVLILHGMVTGLVTSSEEYIKCMRKNGLSRSVILPGTSQYSTAVQDSWVSNAGWNPVAFFEAETPRGIRKAMHCARQIGVGVCPRSGGHSKMGSSLCNGIVIDLWRMNQYHFIRKGNYVKFGAGIPQGELLYHTVKQGPADRFPPGEFGTLFVQGVSTG